MKRLYCPYLQIRDNKIYLSDKNQIHYIKNVVCLKENDKVVIFDDRGNEYGCVIIELAKDKVTLDIKNKQMYSSKQGEIDVTVACAIPKNSKMDDIVDKLTQLGISRLIPLQTERVIVRLGKEKRISRHKRWQKIAVNASQQSQRNSVPIVEPVKNLDEVLSNSGAYDLKLIPTLIGPRKSLEEVIYLLYPKNVLVLIGPEGDFTSEEVDLAKKFGFIPVSLGKLTLRVETAAVAVASFIKLYSTGAVLKEGCL